MWSSAFLHADYSHLFFNLFTLWVFSGAILMKLGEFYYIIIYFLSLYFGNLFTLKQHKNQVLYSAVGASGAVTGNCLFLYIIISRNETGSNIFSNTITILCFLDYVIFFIQSMV